MMYFMGHSFSENLYLITLRKKIMFVFIFHNNVTIIAILLHAWKKCHVAQSSIYHEKS